MGEYDVAVIGAGPAGLAGAVAAAEAGLRVALIDGGRQLGGQYFRHPAPGLGARRPERLHHGWQAFEALAARATGIVDVFFDHHVWAVDGRFRVHATVGQGDSRQSVLISSRALLIATGAYERQIPFPGWDLPGVFTAGGAQALLKGNLVLAGKRIVVAGTGPLLLPVAAGLVAAGAQVLGLFEANHFRGYARHPLPLLANPGKLIEGAGYARQLAQARVPVRTGFAVVAAEGTDSVEAVRVARLDGSGTERRIECDTLAVGFGLVPQVEIGLELGCAHRILADGSVALVVDDDLRTSIDGIWAAGESVGVAGAQTALVEGEIAGLAIARALTASPASSATAVEVTRLKRRRTCHRAFADLILRSHPIPPAWQSRLTPETTICRCEEVPTAAITEAVTALGATDARTIKLLTRAGMGWCQGRMCGYAVACLAASGEQPHPADLLAAAKRPLARPVLLALLAEGFSPILRNHGLETGPPIR